MIIILKLLFRRISNVIEKTFCSYYPERRKHRWKAGGYRKRKVGIGTMETIKLVGMNQYCTVSDNDKLTSESQLPLSRRST